MVLISNEQLAILHKDALVRSLRELLTPAWSVTTERASGDVVLANQSGQSARFRFNPEGRVASFTGPEGRTYQYEYAADGSVKTITQPSGLNVGQELDDLGRRRTGLRDGRSVVDVTYLGNSNIITGLTYPDHTSLELSYDQAERLTAIKDRAGNLFRAEYEKDSGYLTAIIDANNHRTTGRFDSATGNEEIVFPDGSVVGREYDEEGRVVRLFAGGETTAHLEYEGGLITRVRYADQEELRLGYKAKKWLTLGRSSAGTVRWECEPDGRLVGEEQEGHKVGYAYESPGRLIGMTYPGGDQIRVRRDGEGRIAEVVDWQNGRHLFTYSADDRRSERVCPSQLRELVEYSKTGSPLAVQVFPPRGNGSALFASRYTYDDEDRVLSVTDSVFGSRDYAYDVIGQLRSIKGSRRGANEAFLYDPVGNWKTVNGETVKCNELNQVISQGSRRFSYDARGNLISASGPKGEWRYTYNLRDLLIRAEGPGGVVNFGYDVLGRRLWKRTASCEVRYVWAGDHLIREMERIGARETIRDYLYWPGTFTPLALRVDGHIYCYHTDHLGTPRRLTDGHGQVVWLADYTAFGEARIEMELVRNDLRYPGQQFDTETGLHYNRHRYYSPLLGRYLSRDPLGFEAGPNLYAYVSNQTTHSIDPLGLMSGPSAPKGQYSAPQEGKYDTSLGPPNTSSLQDGVNQPLQGGIQESSQAPLKGGVEETQKEPLQGGVEETKKPDDTPSSKSPPPSGHGASSGGGGGSEKPKRKMVPLEPIRDTSLDAPPKVPKFSLEAKETGPPPTQQPLIPLEPIYDHSFDKPPKGPQFSLEVNETGPPPNKRPLVPMEPIYDHSLDPQPPRAPFKLKITKTGPPAPPPPPPRPRRPKVPVPKKQIPPTPPKKQVSPPPPPKKQAPPPSPPKKQPPITPPVPRLPHQPPGAPFPLPKMYGRTPDFFPISVSGGEPIGFGAVVIFDRYGHKYWSPQITFGLSVLPVSVGGAMGWIDQKKAPSADELSNFLTGFGWSPVQVSAGAYVEKAISPGTGKTATIVGAVANAGLSASVGPQTLPVP